MKKLSDLKKPTLQESMKALREMNLLDKFLFNETMNDPKAHEAALQIILGQETLRLLTPAQTEKELQTAPWLRSIRLDVYALDQQGTVYDTEMQAQKKNDLRRRSRFYQGLIDSSLLERGEISFNALNDVCIIMITPFDLFGEGKYCYTFVPCCKEDKEIELEDGAVRIFLNTRGKNDQEISWELREFLHYVECTEDEVAKDSGSERIRTLHACVSRIKASEEAGVKYMQRWEERFYDRQEAREEGREEGILLSLRKLIDKQKMTVDRAMDFMDISENDRERYLIWLNKPENGDEETE